MSGARPPLLEARDLHFRWPEAAAPAVDGVGFDLPPGSFLSVIGPNGSGKSTLLGLVLGARTPESGTVHLEGRPIAAWDRTDLARTVGYVPQSEDTAFPMRVREVVAMGRYPHMGPWRAEGPVDREAIEEGMERCCILEFRDRDFGTLSGGERQRVRIARALAQRPSLLVLDEPTAALDLRHEMSIFELLRLLVDRDGMTVLLVTHHVNLAARHADALLLLDQGRAAATGTPAEVLDPERLRRVFGWPVRVDPFPGPGPDRGSPMVTPLSSRGTVREG